MQSFTPTYNANGVMQRVARVSLRQLTFRYVYELLLCYLCDHVEANRRPLNETECKLHGADTWRIICKQFAASYTCLPGLQMVSLMQ